MASVFVRYGSVIHISGCPFRFSLPSSIAKTAFFRLFKFRCCVVIPHNKPAKLDLKFLKYFIR